MKNFVAWVLYVSCLFLCSSIVNAAERNVLTGKITMNGHPFPEAVVSLYLIDKTFGSYNKNIFTKTSDNGSYRFETLQNGTYVLLVRKGTNRVYQGKLLINEQRTIVKNIDLRVVPDTTKINEHELTRIDFGSKRVYFYLVKQLMWHTDNYAEIYLFPDINVLQGKLQEGPIDKDIFLDTVKPLRKDVDFQLLQARQSEPVSLSVGNLSYSLTVEMHQVKNYALFKFSAK